MQPWTFSPLLGKQRISQLISAYSFELLLEEVVKSCDVLCVHRKDCDDMAGFSRIIATLFIPPNIFDLFFNSQAGYRGSYARSPYVGLEANDQALKRLTPLVLAKNEGSAPNIDPHFIRESLGSPSAKIWLAEDGLHLCSLCEGDWVKPKEPTTEIFVPTWESAEGIEAVWGRKAPYLKKLKLIGAFLTDRYDEYIPFHKRRRAELIYKRGWA